MRFEMGRVLTVEVAEENASNVRYRAAFLMRDIEPDPDAITGRIPVHVMDLAAAIQSLGQPGSCSIFQAVEFGDGDTMTDTIGEIVLGGDGTIQWEPCGGSVEGPIVAALKAPSVA
jgi:hypothetical protein